MFLLLKDGEVVCDGPHSILWDTCAIYREMFLKSTGGVGNVVDSHHSKYSIKN
ncbi:MAG: hypothetical protein ABIM42_04610 [candidate division WOR-3 bacterium]